MSQRLFVAAPTMVALLLSISCVGVNPATSPAVPTSVASRESSPGSLIRQGGHFLWASYLVYYDPAGTVMETVPQRAASAHWNVLTFLEQGTWPNCITLQGITPNPDGSYDVYVNIKHPFFSPNLTGFDVRGIVMFNGSHQFPASGLSTSDPSKDEGALLNADGFTTLYNPATALYAPFEGYVKGKFAMGELLNAQLNGYKRFISNPAKPRAVFGAGAQVTVTYKLHLPPAPLVFGYAVDASWAPPINKPVTDPWSDFGPEANCPEPWKILATEVPSGNLTECGGSTTLVIDVYDWQGKDLSHPVLIECPELFDGRITAAWKEDGPDYTRYQATVENLNYPPAGSYACLVSKSEDPPADKPWMDPTAYQIRMLNVSEAGEPTDPVVLKRVATPDGAWDVTASGGYAYVPLTESLLVIDLDPPEAAQIVKAVDIPIGLGEVVVCDGYAYVAAGSALHIVDVDPPEEAEVLNTLVVPSSGHLAVSGGFAYVTGGTGLLIVDIDPPEEAEFVNVVNTPKNLAAVAVSGGYAYAPDLDGHLVIIDVDPPEWAFIENRFELAGGLLDVKVLGGYAYVGAMAGLLSDGRLHVVDVDPPQDAYKVKSVPLLDPVQSVALSCGYAYLAVSGQGPETANGVAIVDVDPPEEAHLVTTVVHQYASGVDVSGRFAYSAAYEELIIVKLW